MKNGDISNIGGKLIGVDFFTLFSRRKKNIIEKILNEPSLEINKVIYDFIINIYKNTEYAIKVFIEPEEYEKYCKELEYNHTFIFEILEVSKFSKTTRDLMLGDIFMYIVNDDYRISLLNNDNAVRYEDIISSLKRKYR